MSALERILKRSLAQEKTVSALTDEALEQQWGQWSFDLLRQRTTLDQVLPEALAFVKEAAFRAGGLRAYPCQTRAIIALLEPAITEVATGEGKTLITALAACLRALPKRGVHVATVNAYLSERDFEFATPIAARLGLTVGFLKQEQSHAEKRAAYQCDITYGTGYDFGFDYLRDQLALLKHAQHGPSFRLRNLLTGRKHPEAEVVQRPLASAIVDEIDSVLIDEAASPLVIAQPSTERTVPEAYLTAHEAAQGLHEGHDFILDARGRNARLTEEGRSAANQLPGIPWDALVRPWHQYLTNALNAHHAFHHGEHYILQEGKVVIVDEFTGRAHEERSWQQGLHQAVAAKEGVDIPPESHTAASITRQRYFRLYDSLSGLTGTGSESRKEFQHFFQLPVRPIAPNKPSRRQSLPDRVYRNRDTMLHAVAEEVKQRWLTQQPVLVGTRTIKISEDLAAILTGIGVPHRVLNARQDSEENDIIAQAGQPGSVVVATNMAGRGTHISLPPEALALGGLHVVGVERSESIRVDRQLAGRCARQGQPGTSLFFLSAEDNLIEQFAPDTGKQLARMAADPDGRLPDAAARLFSTLQSRVQKLRYAQRIQMEQRDRWMDQTRKSLA
ncbi:hypothetical protein [Verrucomicrobium sp. BvORR034]|uniref:preprotein translocase subunit SecA n=1 Tax=Verrucomicrobium sp. BvORR034 TaxID=1396418 RepID=UPI000678C7D6|nr:hypothetical protein [Verrucomicrobium sp. BvORR034]